MATVVRTLTGPLLLAIQAQLMTFTNFPAERVLMTRGRKMPHYQADQDYVLWPRGFQSMALTTDGGGRTDTRLRRTLTVLCRSRFQVDPENNDLAWFTDPTYGVLPLEDMAVDALHLFLPVDNSSNQNAILVEPMRCINSADYVEDQNPKHKGWGFSTLHFEMVMPISLNQSFQ